MGTDMITSISYSTDNGSTWTITNNVNNKEEHLQITVNVSEGDKILWKGNAKQLGYFDDDDYGDHVGSFFSSDCEFNVEGNVMSMLYGDNFIGETTLEENGAFAFLFSDYDGDYSCNVVDASNLVLPATTLTYYCYRKMFCGCTLLTSAPMLPATTLEHSCYSGMFTSCESLTSAPQLQAVTLANYCYSDMFNYCTSLTSAPQLPATTLASGCYSCMFYYCTSLTNAPQLLATILATGCYSQMFHGCTSLNSITCLATDISASNCTTDWVNGVAATGTFIKANSMSSWTTGNNGIPTGWNTYTESEYRVVRHYELDDYDKKPLVIEVDDTDTTVPSGTYTSITAALAAGREVIVNIALIDYGDGEILSANLNINSDDIDGGYNFETFCGQNYFSFVIENDDSCFITENALCDRTHTHGNIQSSGTLQTTDISIANGDKLVVTDSSDSSKVARTSVTFDGSTTSKALTQKGTWESFAQAPLYIAISSMSATTVPSGTYTSITTALAAGREVYVVVGSNLHLIPFASDEMPGEYYVFSGIDQGTCYSVLITDEDKVITTTNDLANSSHTHGNLTSDGKLQTTDVTIANGDKLVITDNSNSNKVARTSVSFDGSTTTQALSKKGTWENFLKTQVYLGTCSTSANTYVKEATVDTFPLDSNNKPLTGTVVGIKFSNTNTYATSGNTYQLNVNNTGNYPMYYNNAELATSTTANTLVAGYKNRYTFYMFNGTQWVFLFTSYDTNTTYSAMTQAEIDAGTSTTGRTMTPARLRSNFYTEGEVDTLLLGKANAPLIIEIEEGDTTVPTGTIASINAALTANKQVLIKYYAPGSYDDYVFVPLDEAGNGNTGDPLDSFYF